MIIEKLQEKQAYNLTGLNMEIPLLWRNLPE